MICGGVTWRRIVWVDAGQLSAGALLAIVRAAIA
jgi:hypothetical protein